MSNESIAAHTPGPWSLESYPDGAFCVSVMLSPISPLVICARNPLGGRAAESIANARLIAVTPELLYALQRLIAIDDAHATLHAPDGDDVARMIEHAEAHKFAREVLARVAPC